MTTLGPFMEGFSSWRRILGSVPPEAQLKVFGNAVEEVASFISRGLNRAVAADELVDMAASIGWDNPDEVQELIARAFEHVDDAERVGDDWSDTDREYPGLNGSTPPPAQRHASKYEQIDPMNIPPRAWLYAGHYTRHTVSATFAPGGFGKTTLQLYEAIKMVEAGYRVWYLSGEDPKVELDRRIAAHCKLHHVELAACTGQLFIDDLVTWPLSIAAAPRPGAPAVFNDRALDELAVAIALDAIDVVILDPLICFHTINENDNASMGAMIKRLAAIATNSNSAFELGHHVRKLSAGGLRTEISVDDGRGGSALLGGVRSARVINRMSTAEAEQADIEKMPGSPSKNFFFRVDIGKRNMAPPPEKATWFRLMSVEIANGDHVQALSPWTFPSALVDVTLADADYVRDLVKARSWRADTRSADWLGIPIARRLGLNIMDKGDVIKIQRMIGIWLSNEVFTKREMRDPESRQKRIFYVAIEQPAAPDNVVQFPGGDGNGDGDEGDDN